MCLGYVPPGPLELRRKEPKSGAKSTEVSATYIKHGIPVGMQNRGWEFTPFSARLWVGEWEWVWV